MSFKCCCTNCCKNFNGNCGLPATQVFNLGCQHYIKEVPDYVDFPTAFKAYEEGKGIQTAGECFTRYYKVPIGCAYFSEKQIRGKWIVLDNK